MIFPSQKKSNQSPAPTGIFDQARDPITDIDDIHDKRFLRKVACLKHDVFQEFLHKGLEPSGAGVTRPRVRLGREMGKLVEGGGLESQLDPFDAEEFGVLTRQGVSWFRKDTPEVVFRQGFELDPDR